MKKRLGLFVSSDQHLDKIISLVRAARRKNVDVWIFLTHTGTLLTKDPRFMELEGICRISICRVSFNKNDLKFPVPGLSEKDIGTQAIHSEIIEECDRYIVF
jgi:hypothetical protein